jgi:hypothetical protein
MILVRASSAPLPLTNIIHDVVAFPWRGQQPTKQNDHERHRRRRRHGPNVDSTVAVAAASSGRPASSAVTYRTLLLLQRTPIRPQSALYTSISVFFPLFSFRCVWFGGGVNAACACMDRSSTWGEANFLLKSKRKWMTPCACRRLSPNLSAPSISFQQFRAPVVVLQSLTSIWIFLRTCSEKYFYFNPFGLWTCACI